MLDPSQMGSAELRDLALAALAEIAEEGTVGEYHDTVDLGEGVYSLRFESKAPGFEDWWWTASITKVDEESAPTVLECGMLPAEGALLAPEWVPWAQRLAEFEETHDSEGNPLPEGESHRESEPPEATIRIRKRTRTRKRRRNGEETEA